ncbi:hypothetical protein CHLNCDRAFT_138537 [Chlorella variabilis]|uniref:Calcineurin-like phosphoesterase domain-containing protein n=1 Tax=Chlorella variabilis TaxID=554065 RepID=E1ZN87_CHLVA|nr:hypothetical protein CHLNCDRAFT_138537 [Chlorella variabilis]EFN52556.1 hypothetical protein CHLNCDRAFT_138537 [Chlorella variabilis]|eukprot:XP_005844658.1 hypothetical protein CHLNCDRAFT_138537 [Chlorella variabilis]
MAASPAQPALWQRLLPPWGTPARSQAGSRSSRGGAPAVALTAATCAAAPLLPGIPEDRPSRRKRLFCFGLLASLVVGVGVASVVLGSQHNSSAAVASSDSAAAAGAAAAGDQGGGTSSGGTSSGSSTEQSGGGGGEGEEAGGEGSGGQGGEQEGSTESEGGIDEGGDDGGGGGQEAAAPAASEQGLAEGGGVPAPTTEWAGASPWDGSGSDAWDSGEEEEEGKGEAPATEKGEGEAGAAPSEEGSTAGGKAGYTLRFLAVGDWGRQGGSNQSEVAELMGRVAAADPPAQFVISTGDNFYEHGLQCLGTRSSVSNHDYCDSAPNCSRGMPRCKYSPLHQMNLALASRESSRRWHLKRTYTESFADGKVQLFFVDTSPFILRYYDKSNSWSRCTGGLWTQSWEEQLLLLEQELAASMADWKLAVGHHPTYSNGHHGNNSEVIAHLQPLFTKYGVQAYLCGHDHNLEHLAVQGYNVIVSGGGSESGREKVGSAFSHYYYPYSGFVSLLVDPEEMVVKFYTLEDDDLPAHTTLITRAGDSMRRP